MKNDTYSQALKEVYVILENSEDKIKNKIPNSFMTFITDNMDKNYIPNIDFYNDDWDNKILEETGKILAIVYRDYLVSSEEREELLKEEAEEEQRIEQELREKYNPDNLFKRNKTNIEDNNDINTSLMVVSETKWYKRLIDKILAIFKRK